MATGFRSTSTLGVSSNSGSTVDNDDATNTINNSSSEAKTIYVGNVPYKVSWMTLKSFFTKFGDVTSAKIINDHFTKKSRGFGFVEFCTYEGFKRALRASSKELQLFQRTLRVSQARTNSYCRTVAKLVIQEDSPEDLTAPIHVLNEDTLLHIFSYLNPVEKIAIERVCRRWRRCSLAAAKQHKHLKIAIGSSKFTSHSLKAILFRCGSSVVSLDLSLVSKHLRNPVLQIIGQFCKNIEKLDLFGISVNDNGIQELANHCKKLRWLNVKGSSNLSEKGFCQLFRNCKKLEHLDCSGNTRFTGKCLIHATSTFKSLRANRCINLTKKGILYLTTRCPLMEVLEVNMCLGMFYSAISSVAKSLKHLKEFSIGELSVRSEDDHPSQNVVQLFVHPKNIVKLELFNCCLIDDNLQMICDSCPMISELDISQNNLTDASVPSLANLEHLEYLSVCHLPITDLSLMAIADKGRLRRLWVQCCSKLTDSSMEVIAKKCTHLQELDVSRVVSLTSNTLKAFQQNLCKRVPGSLLVIYVYDNYFEVDPPAESYSSPEMSVIDSYRPLYPTVIKWKAECEEEQLWLDMQILNLKNAFLNLYCNMESVNWRLGEVLIHGDIFDSDDDYNYDDFYDYEDYDDFLADVYLDNDDPLAVEYWELS